jgi:hypothetical protein
MTTTAAPGEPGSQVRAQRPPLGFTYEEILPSSRPYRLGTRRRKPPQAVSASKAGASRAAGAPSLDTCKQLATSVFVFKEKRRKQPPAEPINCREWLEMQRTPYEDWQRAQWLHGQLLRTVFKVMDKWKLRAIRHDSANAKWLERYRAVQVRIEGESGADAYQRVKQWKKENKPRGRLAQWLKWERAYFAIGNCGKEWLGWRATCCAERTRSIAVPVGCNHRLCPLCAYRRSQLGRVRIKTMFDRLTHPAMVTLTVPNLKRIRQHSFTRFRQNARQWIGQRTATDLVCRCGCERDSHRQPGENGKLKRTLLGCRFCDCQQWRPVPAGTSLEYEFLGGVYSMETTRNRQTGTWHVHAHILADLNHALPPKFLTGPDGKKHVNMVEFYGKRVFAFTALKWRMEFDWLLLTGGREEWGVRPKNDPPAKSHKAISKWRRAWEYYYANFMRWVLEKRDHSTIEFKVKRGRRFVLRSDLTPAEWDVYAAREAWNAANTRVFHIEPVTDREGAAREVLKYITKVADFSDQPDAIEEFSNATRGARLVQTFGTWYGFAVDVEFDVDHLDDWSKRPECACGLNHWEKVGVYHYHHVLMDEAGRFYLRESALKHDHGGTVAHPRIRAGDPLRSKMND